MLLERLAEGGVAIVTGRVGNLGNVHRPHPQLSPRAFHAHAPHVAGNVLAGTGSKDAMKVRHRESGDGRQHFPIQRLVTVIAHVSLDSVNAFVIAFKAFSVSRHNCIVTYQNTCSLF